MGDPDRSANLRWPSHMESFFDRLSDSVWDQVLGLCPSCGGASSGICEACWAGWKRDGPWLVRARPFPQRSLLRWEESNEKSVQRLVLSMKERPRRSSLRIWANELSLALAAEWGRAEILIVHPPGRSGRRELDHAGALAAEVARCLAVPLGPELRRLQARRSWGQKLASRRSRHELEFVTEAAAREALRARAKPVVFVDDVLTSGATAEAAWRALGEPPGFQAWSIFGRDRLDSGEGSG
jgi:predicted amidophosphoribosyltransferase